VNPEGTVPNVTLVIVVAELVSICQYFVAEPVFVITTLLTGVSKLKTFVEGLVIPMVVILSDVEAVVEGLEEELEVQPVMTSNDNPNKQKMLTRTITIFFAIINSSLDLFAVNYDKENTESQAMTC